MPIERNHIYQLKITLLGSRPPIWRRLLVPSSFTLGEFHHVIQVAMGWADSHMHMFRTKNGVAYGNKAHDEEGMLNFKDEWTTSVAKVLRKPKKVLFYDYDFGDGWEHEILLEKQFPLISETLPAPECVKAVGACPPEDVGGIGGYHAFLEAIADPNHPEHADTVDWWGDNQFNPTAVDLDQINEQLRNPQAFAPEDYPFEDLEENPLNGLAEEFFEHVGDREFGSEEELQNAFDDFMIRQACEPLDDFHGLTPDQMHALLYNTFSTPELVEWNFSAATASNSPALRVVSALLEKLQTGKLKLTAKGNLPLAVVRELLAKIPQEECPEKLRSEEEVQPVHLPRVFAEMSQLTVWSPSTLTISGEGQKLFAAKDWPEIYQRLLLCMLAEFNWAYIGGRDELPSLQTTAPFSFWLLHRFGAEWRDSHFYAEQLAKAFPHITAELEATPYLSERDLLSIVVFARLFPLLKMFGLIEERAAPPSTEGKPSRYGTEVRATPLFRELLHWKTRTN